MSALLAACAGLPPVPELPPVAELDATPFHPQLRYQCGPAALLTVLEHSGVPADMDTLVRQVYLPAARGSLQAEMLAATRRADRIPYRIDASLAGLAAELRAGRPVLVLQNLGTGWLPRWHYAVVVGLQAGEVVLRSGTERRRVTALTTFLRTWRRSGYWGFVTLPPGELPARPDPDRWFRALAEAEETGRAELARAGWRESTRRWPTSLVAHFGLGNSEYALMNWAAAEQAYRVLLGLAPGQVMVRNNLALALLQLQRFDEAEREALAALALVADASLEREIVDTLARIRERRDQSRSGNPSSTSR